MKRNPCSRIRKPNLRNEKGQAILLILVAMALLLVGAIGFSIDGAQMYAQREMAQAAADAAAQAGIESIYTGTNSTEPSPFGTATGSISSCTTPTDARTPCAYAQRDGFNTSADTVKVDFLENASAPFATSGNAAVVNEVRVTITRTLKTTLLQFLGPATSTIKATATAAIISVVSPTPIIVTHPTLSGSFSTQGNPTVTICGGPSQSIQVNSSSKTAVSVGGSALIDLSHAGPLDPGNCTTGTGANFGVFGGPEPTPGGISLGTTGKYIPGSLPIYDPFGPQGANVSAPAQPAAAQLATPLGNGVEGCPASPKKSCSLYYPGLYASGLNIKNETAVFSPGIYYMTGSTGFGNAANGEMYMATGVPADGTSGTNTGWAAGNMMVYNTGTGTFNVGANAAAFLVGSPNGSAYKGILFFEDRSAGALAHTLGGGGGMSLSGTIYLENQNQALTLQGGSGSSTLITGEIIVGTLTMGGNSGITMNLNPASTIAIQKIALVN